VIQHSDITIDYVTVVLNYPFNMNTNIDKTCFIISINDQSATLEEEERKILNLVTYLIDSQTEC